MSTLQYTPEISASLDTTKLSNKIATIESNIAEVRNEKYAKKLAENIQRLFLSMNETFLREFISKDQSPEESKESPREDPIIKKMKEAFCFYQEGLRNFITDHHKVQNKVIKIQQKLEGCEHDISNKIYRREFDQLFEDKTMKFKVKIKSRITKVEDHIHQIETKNVDHSVEVKQAVYKIEEDTIKKLIRLNDQLKNKMDINSVYDHVQFETKAIKEEQKNAIEDITTKLENRFNKLHTKYLEIDIKNNQITSSISNLSNQIIVLEQDFKDQKAEIIEQVSGMIEDRLESKLQPLEQSIHNIDQKTKERFESNLSQIKRIDEEIKEFFSKPIARPAEDPTVSAGAPPESFTQYHVEIDAIKNRLQRLQYDTNRSLNALRDELKEEISDKIIQTQFENFVEPKEPSSPLKNKSVSSKGLPNFQVKRQIEQMQENLKEFQSRIDKRVNSLKVELNFDSLYGLIKDRAITEEVEDKFNKVDSRIRGIKENQLDSKKDVERIEGWVLTLSKATSDIEKMIKTITPLALNKELDSKCLSCGQENLKLNKSSKSSLKRISSQGRNLQKISSTKTPLHPYAAIENSLSRENLAMKFSIDLNKTRPLPNQLSHPSAYNPPLNPAKPPKRTALPSSDLYKRKSKSRLRSYLALNSSI
ncbi:unnamed protein product [Moneuplotes crassus]|uniref:Uncharacterized protein n=1 Tax=Euplotes crassus TaxID=5936 RepID=A0AAD1X690_EUPCR|nr:unnamed protein product [Moneuplotes crassus]